MVFQTVSEFNAFSTIQLINVHMVLIFFAVFIDVAMPILQLRSMGFLETNAKVSVRDLTFEV